MANCDGQLLHWKRKYFFLSAVLTRTFSQRNLLPVPQNISLHIKLSTVPQKFTSVHTYLHFLFNWGGGIWLKRFVAEITTVDTPISTVYRPESVSQHGKLWSFKELHKYFFTLNLTNGKKACHGLKNMHICFQSQNFVNYVRKGDVPDPLFWVPIKRIMSSWYLWYSMFWYACNLMTPFNFLPLMR